MEEEGEFEGTQEEFPPEKGRDLDEVEEVDEVDEFEEELPQKGAKGEKGASRPSAIKKGKKGVEDEDEDEEDDESKEIKGKKKVSESKAGIKDSAKAKQSIAKENGGKPKEKTSKSSLGDKQQQLFLIEFLVDTVTIDSYAVDEEVLEGQTCLSLSFLNFPPMEICEKDFDPNKEMGFGKVRFNSGKSLMFAFNEHQCDHPPPLSVEITVSKKLEEGDDFVKVDIGTIKICVSELFKQIVEIAKFHPDKLPSSKSIKDCFMLIGPGKRTMGEISVYIRLSCLGQNIVTEFQCGSDLQKSPVLFKNRDGKKVFEISGNEMDSLMESEGMGIGPKRKIGCGCIRSSMTNHNQKYTARGGQGDAERLEGKRKGSKLVLDVTDKKKQAYPIKNINNKHEEGGELGVKVSQMNVSPDHNTFVLKVGDKGQIPDRGKMILEFKTPKQRISQRIIPPYHEDIGVQTESLKKGKGKGKGKKKKK